MLVNVHCRAGGGQEDEVGFCFHCTRQIIGTCAYFPLQLPWQPQCLFRYLAAGFSPLGPLYVWGGVPMFSLLVLTYPHQWLLALCRHQLTSRGWCGRP